jgi:hypothetical protein
LKAKEYLNKIRTIEAGINADIEEIESLTTLATKVTSVINDDRVQTSSDQQKIETYSVKIADLKSKIARELVEFLDYKKTVIKLIRESCSTDCITLLHKRYFQYKKWEEIAVEMNYSYQWVSDGLHKKALSQVQKALDEMEKEG